MPLPPIAPGKIPPFYSLGEDPFEDLCRELVQEDQDVHTAERYGTRGQRQEGVDIIIEYNNGSKAAGQCKSHERCDEKLVRDACTEFLKHAQRWQQDGIRSFVLFLAADTRRTQLHRERSRQRERLRQAGFSFSVWSGAVIKSKLRKQRPLVRHFMPTYEDYICGSQTHLELRAEAQAITIRTLAHHIGEAAEGEHAELRKLWQDGHPRKALERLKKVRADAEAWAVLPAPTKATFLRLLARLVLTTGDVRGARTFAAEADEHDAQGGNRVEAMIAQAEGRLDDAIAVLDHDPDPDSQVLKIAILIQKGAIEAAVETISAHSGHADAHRLHALILLSRGETQKAKAEAERAVSLAPTWYWMRHTAAAIRYLSSLSPLVTPKGIPQWPEPPHPTLVREDAESIAARKSAAIEFGKLIQEAEHSKDEAACLEVWRVACLVDDQGSRTQAVDVAKMALQSDPGNYRIMMWVLARELDIPIERTVGVLAQRVEDAVANVEEVVALVAAHATVNRFAEAKSLLAKAKDIFAEARADGLYRFWDSQLSRLETALRQKHNPADDFDAVAVGDFAGPEDSERELHTERWWRRQQLLARADRWAEIAPEALEIVESVQTSDAVRLACHALFNTHDFVGALKLLDRAPAYFAGAALPPDLRRLRILAQHAVGALPAAIGEAQRAFEDTPTSEGLMELARLLFQVGDLKTLAIAARRHDKLSDLTASDTLTLAFFLQLEAPELATTLWRRANAQEIPDELVGTAFEIGNGLGLDTELKPLVLRISALGAAGKGGVRGFDISELSQWAIQRRQQLDEVWERFRHGQIPSHTALGILGVNMATAYHGIPALTAGRTDGETVGPVYARFGGRLSDTPFIPSNQPVRLNVDITALLTAAHFGFIARIEAAFAPIRLPRHTVVALSEMEAALRPRQPRHLDAKRRVLDAVIAGKITTVDLQPILQREDSDGDVADDVLQLLRYARAVNGLVLDFLPVRSQDPTQRVGSLPNLHGERLRDAHAIIDALFAGGALSSVEHQNARERLGLRHGVPLIEQIPPGAELVCRGAVLELIASVGVLDSTAGAFRLLMDKEDAREVQAEVAAALRGSAEADWVRRLIGRVSDGLSTGVYEMLPAFQAPSEQRGDHEPTPAEAVLLELMSFPTLEKDVIWIDDRLATSLEHRDAARVAGTIDILGSLVSRREMSEAEFLQALTDMRAEDVRFVAFAADELLTLLLEAPLEQSRLVETKGLRVARQYYARCLLAAGELRRPSTPQAFPDTSTEWNFLLGCGSAISSALVRVWDRSSAQEAERRAEWVLRNLYTDDRGIYATSAPRTEANDTFRIVISLVGLVTNALQLKSRRARRDYLKWVYRRTLRSRFAADSVLAVAFTEQLKHSITSNLAKDDVGTTPMWTLLMRRLWSDMPRDLRRLLEPDQSFLQALGISMTSVIEIEALKIEKGTTWAALAGILRDRTAIDVQTVDGQPVKISLVSEEPLLFAFACEPLGMEAQIGGPEFWLLSDSLEQREKVLAGQRDWFDMPRGRREELIARIVGGQDAATRFDLASAARQNSGAAHYRRLVESLEPGASFRPEDSSPQDPMNLLDHLRLQNGRGGVSAWSERAAELVADVGIVSAINRLGGLPIDLSEVYADALARMDASARRRAMRRIRHTLMCSPVGLVQVVRLWQQVAPGRRGAVRIRSRLASLFAVNDRSDVFEAWRTVLSWVDEQFGFHEPLRELNTDIRLALVWTHADRVFRILRGAGLEPPWIQNAFTDTSYPIAHEVVFASAEYSNDVVAPRHVSAESFALAALAAIGTEVDIAAGVSARAEETFGQMKEDSGWRVVRAMMAEEGAVTNALGSWLVSGRKWLPLMPSAVRDGLSHDAVSVRVREACEGLLAKSEERSHWGILRATLGRSSPSPQTVALLQSLVEQLDLSAYLQSDATLAVVSADVLGTVAKFFDATVRRQLEIQLIAVARELGTCGKIGNEERDAISNAVVGGLLSCAWSEDPETRAEKLARVFEELDAAAPAVLRTNAGFILRLCETLPTQAARHFWRLRESMRLGARL